MSNANKTLAVLSFAALLYVPFTFFGIGSDPDSDRILRITAPALQQGRYEPSRPPGYFVHEICTVLLYRIGGSVLSNLGTVAMSLLGLHSFLRICGHFEIAHRHLLGLFMALHPIYWVASTSSIDYLWALGLLLAAFEQSLRQRGRLAALLFGLAVGARLGSVLFVGAWALARLVYRPEQRRATFATAVGAGLIGAACYYPAFASAGGRFTFLTFVIGEWSGLGYVARFVYRNIYFWGLQTVLVAIVLLPRIVRGFARSRYRHAPELILFCGLNILLMEALYFRVPLEQSYLLPILPSVLLLLGMALREQPGTLTGLLAAQFTYGFVNFNLARPDQRNVATTGTPGFWVEPGYLVRDARERLAQPVSEGTRRAAGKTTTSLPRSGDASTDRHRAPSRAAQAHHKFGGITRHKQGGNEGHGAFPLSVFGFRLFRSQCRHVPPRPARDRLHSRRRRAHPVHRHARSTHR